MPVTRSYSHTCGHQAEQVKVKRVITQLEQDLAKVKAQKEQIQKKLEDARKKTGASAVAVRKQFKQKLDDLKVSERVSK